MTTFFTSDLHLGHANALEHCQRPFTSVEEMNEMLIENWNRKVQMDDEIYIIGDFAYRSACPVTNYLTRLNGQKHLIIGNHELWFYNDLSMTRFFKSVDHMQVIRLGEKMITLCHYPMFEWNGSRRALNQQTSKSWLIHGHIHNRRNVDSYLHIRDRLPCALNAGVDINHYESVSFEELIANNNAWYKREPAVTAEDSGTLNKELSKLRRGIQNRESRLADHAFLLHAPEQIVNRERDKLEEEIRRVSEIETKLGEIKASGSQKNETIDCL